MKRILCIVGTMDVGGAETFLMKIYRTLDKEKYQMDFCVTGKKEGYYEQEIVNYRGIVYHITQKTNNISLFYKELKAVIKSGDYKYVLRIGADCFTSLDLWIAFICGVKVRAMRSSNTDLISNKIYKLIHYLLRVPLTSIANVKIAPSELAAKYTFGKRCLKKGKVTILKNGININEYSYNENDRKRLRTLLGINDEFIVGHIGRFNEQKNHMFLIEVFNCIHQKDTSSKLVLVGVGELEQRVKNRINELGLMDYVIFTGLRNDIPALLNIFDIFVFPSLFEGMPNVIVEAQANGLKCVIADTITKEVDFANNISFLSLEDPELWAQEILEFKGNERENMDDIMKSLHYDIESVTNEFVCNIFGSARNI